MVDGLYLERDSTDNVFPISPKDLAEGNHELRIIQSESTSLGTVATQIADIGIRRTARRVSLKKSPEEAETPIHRSIHLETLAEEPGETLAVLQGFRLLEERPWTESADWEIDPHRLGLGPITLQAATRYKDGAIVRSEPLRFEVIRPQEGPLLELVSESSPSGTGIRIHATSTPDAEIDWMQVLPLQHVSTSDKFTGTIQWNRDRLDFESSESASSLLLTPKKNKDAPTSIVAHLLSTPTQVKGGFRMLSGIVFNYSAPQSFDFFAMSADRSEWIFGEYGNGIFNNVQTRGGRIRFRESYLMTVRSGPGNVLEGWVNGELILQTDELKLGKGGAGLLLGQGTSRCHLFAISPVGGDLTYQLEGNSLRINDPPAAKGTEFMVVAWEREATTQTGIRLTGDNDDTFGSIDLLPSTRRRQ
jgi:hypothetical protein